MPQPEVLWRPSPDASTTTKLGQFMTWCEARFGREFLDYDALWLWSTTSGLEDFWAAVWEFFEVQASVSYTEVLDERVMPGAKWFSGARLNFAENALLGGDDDVVAIIGISDSRSRQELTWGALRNDVGRARAGLQKQGVGKGDCVAAYLPNIHETVVGFLATASLGAIWTSCAPEFGVQAVLDRFSQVAPKVLIAVDGYRHGARDVSKVEELTAIRAGLPSLQQTVIVPYAHELDLPDATAIGWRELIAKEGPLEFEQVAPDDPLYVLYSSGTTGLPKPIVHGHGGVLVEHLKVLGLHSGIGPDDRFFWFTTTGWMMWNYLVSGLLVGATVVLFDGDPNASGLNTLWSLAADERVTWLGLGAPFIAASAKAELTPGTSFDLSRLKAIGATGSPLSPESFQWVYDAVSPDVMLSPISGGTDVCSAFVGSSPLTPVWLGEIPCRYLGAAVAAFDVDGTVLVGQQGELVLTQPMPSMPVGFWGDPDGSRYRAAYFDDFPGVWRHGDWVTFTERGSCVISGRSDATLNRGGVRVGTAEIYRVVEAVDGVIDSLVVHIEDNDSGGPGVLVLFVVLGEQRDLDVPMIASINAALRANLSPRHAADEMHRVKAIPTTLSGKKLELPVKKILCGADPTIVASRGSLKDAGALDAIIEIASRRRTH